MRVLLFEPNAYEIDFSIIEHLFYLSQSPIYCEKIAVTAKTEQKFCYTAKQIWTQAALLLELWAVELPDSRAR
ncbi:MAG: hypothetical protein U0Z26_01740 [Anaerolineales bacterium]